ncbi:MAG TPA: hypothetical protein VEZ55_15255 [Chitinophagaceae bacterium]|nr:hypothetical protein [Chitinophagaceae bacterium]
MKNLNFNGLTILILALASMSFSTLSASTPLTEKFIATNDETGRIKLTVNNVSARLEENKTFIAYVQIAKEGAKHVPLSMLINVTYSKGQLQSEMLELPLGAYKLEQLVLIPDTNAEKDYSTVRFQLPVNFIVEEE